jgi:hypothetical protein
MGLLEVGSCLDDHPTTLAAATTNMNNTTTYERKPGKRFM